MNFLSIEFALFLAAVVPLYWICPPRSRPLFLTAASYVFYCFWSALGAAALFGITAAVYYAGLTIQRRRDIELRDGSAKAIAAWGIGLLLVWLFLFKTLGLLQRTMWDGGGEQGLGRFLALHAIVPLGISYYTFKLISYLLDIYWGKFKAEREFARFAAYVAFFPQVVAGPIQRSEDFLSQTGRFEGVPEKIRRGLRRILLGCFKKAVIADNLTRIVDSAYALQGASASSLPAFYIFPLQLFADFSALTDIAIGVALLLGIESPENFDRPFLASSISQFWRRWHMSLTNWLTDYVFFPLRMATRRAGKAGLVFSILVNMLLIGIWHNLSWTFVAFGVLHGVFLSIDVLTARLRARFFAAYPNWDRCAAVVGTAVTFHLVALGMVFARAASLRQVSSVLARVVTVPSAALAAGLWRDPNTRRGLAGLAAWIAFEYMARLKWGRAITSHTPVRWVFYYGVVLLIVRWGHDAEAFIYYKF